MGEFNFTDINWTTMEHGSVCSSLIGFPGDNYLVQHIKEPTRYGNILQLLIISRKNQITGIEVDENIASCDHNLISSKVQKSFRIGSCISVISDLKKLVSLSYDKSFNF